MCKYITESGPWRRPPLPCLEPMGIAGACANYFFDEFASVRLAVCPDFLACANGQNIGSVAVELAHADAGDAGQVPVVLGDGLGDGHQRLVGEHTERRLSAAPGLLR